MSQFICSRLCRRSPLQHLKDGGGAAARIKRHSWKGKAFPHIGRHSREKVRAGVDEGRKLYFLCGQKREEPGAVFVRAKNVVVVVPTRDNVIKFRPRSRPVLCVPCGAEILQKNGVLQNYAQQSRRDPILPVFHKLIAAMRRPMSHKRHNDILIGLMPFYCPGCRNFGLAVLSKTKSIVPFAEPMRICGQLVT